MAPDIRSWNDALLRTLMGREGSIHAAHPSASLAPVPYRSLPRELRGAWVCALVLAPASFAGSGSPCEGLLSQQPAHLQRGIHRRTILISVFLPDFGSLPAFAAVPVPWEISFSGSGACWAPHPVPRCFWGRGDRCVPLWWVGWKETRCC